jgi:hypothetical protein
MYFGRHGCRVFSLGPAACVPKGSYERKIAWASIIDSWDESERKNARVLDAGRNSDCVPQVNSLLRRQLGDQAVCGVLWLMELNIKKGT